MADHEIRPGMLVSVLTALGDWQDAVAVTAVEPTHMGGRKVHDFPVIWVSMVIHDEPIPWPAENVRLRGYQPKGERP